jgi:hypothetical protein
VDTSLHGQLRSPISAKKGDQDDDRMGTPRRKRRMDHMLVPNSHAHEPPKVAIKVAVSAPSNKKTNIQSAA